MTDFQGIGRDRREEWRRQETTAHALAALREAETVAAIGVLRAAEAGADQHTTSLNAGIRLGIKMALDLLTEETHDKQTR
jgi:hypothetical protein